MQVFWLVLLGFFGTGYLVLEGLDFGVGMLLPFFGRRRDDLIKSISPLFLGSEVWLVATGGTLIGAFPTLEARLLETLYPVFVVILVCWMLRDAGLWLRTRGGPRWRAGWDRVITVASALLAFGWGVVLGNLAGGLTGGVLGPVPLLGGVLMVLLCALHGAVFLGVRLPDQPAGRALAVARVLTLPAGAILVWLAVAATIGGPSSVAELLLALALVAVLVVTGALAGRKRLAPLLLAVTSLGVAAILPLGALGHVAIPAATGPTLGVLTAFVVPVLPILVAYQAWLWWLTRTTVTRRTWSFFA